MEQKICNKCKVNPARFNGKRYVFCKDCEVKRVTAWRRLKREEKAMDLAMPTIEEVMGFPAPAKVEVEETPKISEITYVADEMKL